MLKYIDNCLLVYVLGLLFVLVGLLQLSTDAFGASEVRGFGTVATLLCLGAMAFLALNARQLVTNSWIANVGLLWAVWICVNSIAYGFLDIPLRSWVATVCSYLLWTSMLCFFCVYSRKYPNVARWFKVYFLAVGIFCTVTFFEVYAFRNQPLQNRMATLNNVYYPLLVLPWILLFRNWVFRWSLAALLSVVIFYSMKRTALTAFALAMLTYALVDVVFVQRRLAAAKAIIYALICVAVLAGFLHYDAARGGYFTDRLRNAQEDEGSGRLGIYRETLKLQLDANLTGWVMGHGHSAVENRIGISAHNDWQEVLYDYGVIGFTLLIALHCALIRTGLRLIHSRSFGAPAYAASYGIFLVMSLLSHLIVYPTYFLFLVAFWGVIEDVAIPFGQKRMLKPQARGREVMPMAVRNGSAISLMRNLKLIL